jgi:ATP adenylyltransferase
MPEVLFAPWRYEYLVAEKSEGCIFCLAASSKDDRDSLVVYRGRRVFVILNRYPYTNGHVMVVPNAHVPSLEDLDSATLAELMVLARRGLRALRQAYGAEAFNLGVNIGAPAGAGVVDHVHLHVVPRWAGDTNFMATTAATRVIPEELEQTFLRLDQAWRALPAED